MTTGNFSAKIFKTRVKEAMPQFSRAFQENCFCVSVSHQKVALILIKFFKTVFVNHEILTEPQLTEKW